MSLNDKRTGLEQLQHMGNALHHEIDVTDESLRVVAAATTRATTHRTEPPMLPKCALWMVDGTNCCSYAMPHVLCIEGVGEWHVHASTTPIHASTALTCLAVTICRPAPQTPSFRHCARTGFEVTTAPREAPGLFLNCFTSLGASHQMIALAFYIAGTESRRKSSQVVASRQSSRPFWINRPPRAAASPRRQ